MSRSGGNGTSAGRGGVMRRRKYKSGRPASAARTNGKVNASGRPGISGRLLAGHEERGRHWHRVGPARQARPRWRACRFGAPSRSTPACAPKRQWPRDEGRDGGCTLRGMFPPGPRATAPANRHRRIRYSQRKEKSLRRDRRSSRDGRVPRARKRSRSWPKSAPDRRESRQSEWPGRRAAGSRAAGSSSGA